MTPRPSTGPRLQDWEFGDAFNWAGYNETMAYVASVLAPHGVGLG